MHWIEVPWVKCGGYFERVFEENPCVTGLCYYANGTIANWIYPLCLGFKVYFQHKIINFKKGLIKNSISTSK